MSSPEAKMVPAVTENQILDSLAIAAKASADELSTAIGQSNELRDTVMMSRHLNVIREFTRLYSARSTRVAVAVKIATMLKLNQDDIKPMWKQLTGRDA